MSTSDVKPGERVKSVRFRDEALVVDLLDGRTISVPLVWYPRLLAATPAQRANWRVAGGGFGIHWPDIDEDLSTDGLLRGAPAARTSVAGRQPANKRMQPTARRARRG
ncbi:MAG: DUF2442 domain-containing protein [Vicinamibacterales bacterium]